MLPLSAPIFIRRPDWVLRREQREYRHSLLNLFGAWLRARTDCRNYSFFAFVMLSAYYDPLPFFLKSPLPLDFASRRAGGV